ncbi:Hypothetical_protein [Hexamita inflata]|uniref:Hypothetical_protein n=1 Tax=Hexamita inflata TaxID=28002 RepID=A0AA86R834_9EUKA|nr:Hypothetical protein HINF_LOCUS55673 [Hexamita inflata]
MTYGTELPSALCSFISIQNDTPYSTIFTVSFQFVAKYLLQILSRRNILIRTEESVIPQLGSKLQFSELFLVQKVHYLNCYVAIQNSSIMLLDSNNKLLSIAKSEFQIQPRQQRIFTTICTSLSCSSPQFSTRSPDFKIA